MLVSQLVVLLYRHADLKQTVSCERELEFARFDSHLHRIHETLQTAPDLVILSFDTSKLFDTYAQTID